MKRLWWVLVVSLALLASLWSVRGFDATLQPDDEILAYEIAPEMDVTVSVPGGIGRVLATTWLLVPLGTADAPFPYGVYTELRSYDGELLTTRVFETRSRLSEAVQGANLPSARLADASAWACQPRTFELDVAALGGRSGVLRLALLPNAPPGTKVLLRLTHSVERGQLERQVLERTVSAQEVERIMAQRSSLGFFDIPLERRTDALAHWERRLTAHGRDGRDYRIRRLLLGGPEDVGLRAPWEHQGVPSSPSRRLALNLTGSATLKVRTSPYAEVVLQDGDEVATPHVAGTLGELEFQLSNRGLRTVHVYSSQPQQLLLSTPREHRASWVTARELRVIADDYEVRPDFRHKAYYRLNARDPVRFDMAPTQATLGLDLRAVLDEDEQWRRIEVAALWKDAEGEPVATARHSVRLQASVFELMAEAAVSDRTISKLRVPEGAVRLELYGAPSTLVAAFVDEPGVDTPVPLPPYDQPPPDDHMWRFEPWDVAPFAAVHPDNRELLNATGRSVRVSTQVRLEPLEGFGQALAPRVLVPRTPFIERPLMRAEAYEPGAPLPRNAWVLVGAGETTPPLRVPGDGLLRWMYLAPPDALGGHWALSDLGGELMSEPVVVTNGRGAFELAPRVVELSFTGLGERGMVAVKATPTRPCTIVKQQSVYRLEPRRWLMFPFDRRVQELSSIVVMATGRGPPRPVRLRYRIDGGKLRTHEGFFNRLTEPEGEQVSSTGDFGRGQLWDEVSRTRVAAAPDALTKLVVRLGDDLAVGPHTLQLQFDAIDGNRAPLWVRAVLVGRVLEDQELLP